MGKAFNGPYGHIQGKVGGLVHYMLKGQPIVRAVGVNTKPPTQKQKANRQAMAVTMELLRPALRFINAGFQLEAADTTSNPHNLATSYNKKHALKGEYPNISVDYGKVMVSKGELPLAGNMKMEQENNGIRISWDPKHQDLGDYADDLAMVLVLHPATQQAYCLLNAGHRGAGSCFVEVEGNKSTAQTEVYLCFRSSDGMNISDSVYLGNLNGAVEKKEKPHQKVKRQKMEARFNSISANYFKQIADNHGVKPENKDFRCLEKEYELLKKRLEDPPVNRN